MESLISHFTGQGIMEPKKSHARAMTRVVHAWLTAHGLRAINTFGSNTAEEAWTCGTKRPLHKRSQIDYLACTGGIRGQAWPCSINKGAFRTSDHRPVYGRLEWTTQIVEPPAPRSPSLVGWAPSSTAAAMEFKMQSAGLARSCHNLCEMQDGLESLVAKVDYETAATKRKNFRSSLNAEVRHLAAAVDAADPLTRRQAVHDLRLCKRKRTRMFANMKLRSLAAGRSGRRQSPLQMEVGGVLSSDRSAWLSEAFKFGSLRFGHPTCTFESQRRRLHQLDGHRISRRIDGIHDLPMTLFDVLVARATLKNSTAPGVDGLVPEMFKELPYCLVARICELFQHHFLHLSSPSPSSWNVLEYIGIPKTKHARKLEEYRWLSKLFVFSKWYVNSWRPIFRQQLPPTPVKIYGFQRNHSSDDVVSLLRECLVDAHRFPRPIIVASMDVKTAFDSVLHEVLDDALGGQDISVSARIAMLSGLFGKSGRIRLPDAGLSPDFPFLRGGKQGGVETPDQFNVIMDACFRDLVGIWSAFGMGFRLDEYDGAPLLNHVIWADNVYLVASSVAEMNVMVQQSTDALYHLGLQWKLDSLEFMLGSALQGHNAVVQVHLRDGAVLAFKQAVAMTVLGVSLDHAGCTQTSLDHRLLQAEGVYWKNLSTLHGRGGALEKMQAWYTTAVPSAMHGCSSWALTKHTATRLRRWELKFLRRVFKMRRRPLEGRHAYNVRTARWLDKIRNDNSIPHLHHRVFTAICQAAWREKTWRDNSNENMLQVIRESKSELWWASLKDLPFRARQTAGAVHGRQGPTVSFETVFVQLLGEGWRADRDQHASAQSWKTRCKEYSSRLCEMWHLPPTAGRGTTALSLTSLGQASLASELAPTFAEQPHPSDDLWGEGLHCFSFISDSQIAVNILNGKALLRDHTHAPIYRRITTRIGALLAAGLVPPRPWDDPFQWRPRAYNKQADALCNLVQDCEEDLTYLSADHKQIATWSPHYLVYTDGGCRGQGVSAYAWIIYAVVWDGSVWVKIIIAMCGRVLTQNAHSFITESLALDGAASMLHDLILQK